MNYIRCFVCARASSHSPSLHLHAAQHFDVLLTLALTSHAIAHSDIYCVLASGAHTHTDQKKYCIRSICLLFLLDADDAENELYSHALSDFCIRNSALIFRSFPCTASLRCLK